MGTLTLSSPVKLTFYHKSTLFTPTFSPAVKAWASTPSILSSSHPCAAKPHKDEIKLKFQAFLFNDIKFVIEFSNFENS